MTRYAAVLFALAFGGCHSPLPESETRPPGRDILPQMEIRAALQGEVDFARHVAPVLRERCLYCHEPAEMPGRYSLARRADAFADAGAGPRIVPGRPGASRLVQVLGEGHPGTSTMPAVGDQLTDGERGILTRWVAQGAPWPEGPGGDLRSR